jgi:hypothetical protein
VSPRGRSELTRDRSRHTTCLGKSAAEVSTTDGQGNGGGERGAATFRSGRRAATATSACSRGSSADRDTRRGQKVEAHRGTTKPESVGWRAVKAPPAHRWVHAKDRLGQVLDVPPLAASADPRSRTQDPHTQERRRFLAAGRPWLRPCRNNRLMGEEHDGRFFNRPFGRPLGCIRDVSARRSAAWKRASNILARGGGGIANGRNEGSFDGLLGAISVTQAEAGGPPDGGGVRLPLSIDQLDERTNHPANQGAHTRPAAASTVNRGMRRRRSIRRELQSRFNTLEKKEST